jgi:hypothetical protein
LNEGDFGRPRKTTSARMNSTPTIRARAAQAAAAKAMSENSSRIGSLLCAAARRAEPAAALQIPYRTGITTLKDPE